MTGSPVWHPFTQHATEPPPPLVGRTDGALLHTDRGPLIDAISSWWVITHGHRHPPIMKAIRDTAETLDQVIFAGLDASGQRQHGDQGKCAHENVP